MFKAPITRPDDDPAPDAGPRHAATAPRPIARLVPHSGIQIIDLELPATELAQVLRSFAEHRYATGGSFRTILMPLDRAGSGDVVWHPVSHRALAPDEIMSISGQSAIDTFVGRWVPLPYLRFLGRDDAGEPSFDAGPENWARVFIAAPQPPGGSSSDGDAGDAAVYRLALAFDTRLDAADRSGERRYLAPNSDDALLGASFKLATGAGDLARFASRPWIDGWLRQGLDAYRARPGGGGSRSPFELEHVARYLVLAEVLGRYCAMPEIRFFDTLSKRWPVPITAVDLVLDMTASDTAALLVDRDAGDGGAPLASAAPLALRDLTCPTVQFTGPIPTQVEFALPPFGDAGLSRRSGRPDAFLWPSLARVGQEAVALSLRATATAGVTGQSDLPALMTETGAADDIWRIGVDGGGDGIGPVVSGALLAHVADDGTPLSATDAGRAPALRPRFAPSSLMTFFLAELLLHAVSAVNAVATVEDPRRPTGVRQLRRIVVTVAAGMPDDERTGTLAHVDRAIDLVWRALGWDGARELGAPLRPETSLGAGTELASQLFQFRREIAARYGNDFGPLIGARDGADGGGAMVAVNGPRGPHVVRVASVELGGPLTGAIVTDYAVAGDGMLMPLQAVTERWAEGETGIGGAMAERFILSALTTALADHGIGAPGVFLSRTLDTTTARASAERNLARRLQSKIVRPAAAALLQIARELPPRIASGQRIQSLRGLVERGGGRFDPHAAEFDALAQREGAVAFRLDRVEIRFSQRQLDLAIRAAAAEPIRRAADLVARQHCDFVMLSGSLAAISAIADDAVAAFPLEPGRIVMAARRAETHAFAEPGAGGSGLAALAPARFAGLAGAYLAGRAIPGFEAFDRVVRAISRDASTLMPAPPMLSLPAASGSNSPGQGGGLMIDVLPRVLSAAAATATSSAAAAERTTMAERTGSVES